MVDTASLTQQLTLTAPDAPSWAALFVSLALLVCSGFVSASEIAFFSLSPQDRDKMKEHTHSSDKRTETLLSDSERLLATILIANNLVNVAIITLLNFFCARTVAFASPWLEFILVTVVLSFLLLLFGEIIPKIYSAQNALSFTRHASPVFAVLNALFRPLASLLMHSKGLAGRITSYRTQALTVDDLEQALQLTDKEEIADESLMLQGIIRFSGETVKDIMTPRVDLVDIDVNTPFPQVLATVRDKGFSRMPIFDGTEDNIKGILYTKDLLPHLDKPHTFRWQSLVRHPYFVPETKMIDDLLRDFQKNKVHIAVVVDEFGGTSGIVTMEDILEEIVGEINDEYDELRKPYIRLNRHTYLFEGKCPLVDFLRITGLDDNFLQGSEGDADTLAGLILEIKGEFPQPHERITLRNLTFEVMEMDQRRIVQIKVIVGKS